MVGRIRYTVLTAVIGVKRVIREAANVDWNFHGWESERLLGVIDCDGSSAADGAGSVGLSGC